MSKYIKIIDRDIKETERNSRILYKNMADIIMEKIRSVNQQGGTSFTYIAPISLSGQKLYVVEEYMAYLVRKFRDGGLIVRFMLPNIILFSWIDNRGTKIKMETLDFLLEEDTKSKLMLATSGKPEYEKKYNVLLEYSKSPLMITDGSETRNTQIRRKSGETDNSTAIKKYKKPRGRLIGRKK